MSYAYLSKDEKTAIDDAKSAALYIMRDRNLLQKKMTEWSKEDVDEFLAIVCLAYYDKREWQKLDSEIPF